MTKNSDKQKTTLVNILKGYKKMNQHTQSEKRHRLRRLTWRKSLLESDTLFEMWNAQPTKANLIGLKKTKIEDHIRLRSLMNRIRSDSK